MLSLLSGGIILVIYSLKPHKPYSKKLLGFGYKQPLVVVILFVVELVLLMLLAGALAGFSAPLMGSGTIQLPQLAQGITITVDVLSTFEWPFFFAVVVAGLCVAARLYHRKLAGQNVPVQT
jgi:hypothetical protein